MGRRLADLLCRLFWGGFCVAFRARALQVGGRAVSRACVAGARKDTWQNGCGAPRWRARGSSVWRWFPFRWRRGPANAARAAPAPRGRGAAPGARACACARGRGRGACGGRGPWAAGPAMWGQPQLSSWGKGRVKIPAAPEQGGGGLLRAVPGEGATSEEGGRGPSCWFSRSTGQAPVRRRSGAACPCKSAARRRPSRARALARAPPSIGPARRGGAPARRGGALRSLGVIVLGAGGGGARRRRAVRGGAASLRVDLDLDAAPGGGRLGGGRGKEG
jgi:hypothetical protein